MRQTLTRAWRRIVPHHAITSEGYLVDVDALVIRVAIACAVVLTISLAAGWM
ncbi:MAG: hypothetical protein AB9M53_00530 [Leptothrix sp. (in: b-proteobacteria)]